MFSRRCGSSAEVVLCFFSICIFFNILFCTNTALTTYKRDTLLDINFGRQQSFWDTFSIDPEWSAEIVRATTTAVTHLQGNGEGNNEGNGAGFRTG